MSRPFSGAPRLAEGISREYLLWHRMCPVGRTTEGLLELAVAPDARRDGIPELAAAYGTDVLEVPIDGADLDRLVDDVIARGYDSLELAAPTADDDMFADARDLANQPPVIRYVNMLVRDAYETRASDIHLESTRDGLISRFRIDGVLTGATAAPAALHQAIVSRIKLLAELDIAERRRPQDGRIRVRLESRELDLRISTVPTMHGESVVLRLLDRGGRPVGLTDLGMSNAVLNTALAIATRPHGMLLVTGPTGSGKTTTLYAALQSRDAQSEKIITVEDPIEYQLPDVTQMPVNGQASVTFATALRAILRQDPDVIMVGEMRDRETAEIAVQAAMTGHFVFTTLHTTDAASAIPRLMDLGIPDYLAGGTVEAVLAQRLVRRICGACRVSYEAPAGQVAAVAGRPIGRQTLERGAGCPACRGTGFSGRSGIFELLVVTDEVRDAIASHAGRAELRALAIDNGMTTLRADGWSKVQQGITTVDEILRVTHE